MVAAGATRPLATGARCDGGTETDMVKLISFGADAGHLMEELLEHAGIGEVDVMTASVQPEADGAVMALLREAAEGRWAIRMLDKAGPADGEGDDVQVERVSQNGMWGEEIDGRGKRTGTSIFRGWETIGQLHIY
jgi:hypothetical protein